MPDPRIIQRDATLLFSRLQKLDVKNVKLNFLGSSPPELFVGRFNYPKVFTGILAPAGHTENANLLSHPEEWFKHRLSIDEILKNRGSMVYGRFLSEVKSPSGRLVEVMQEISMAEKQCDVEFFLKKKPKVSVEADGLSSPVGNPAPLEKARLTENTRVIKRVEYAVGDTDFKAKDAVLDLYSHKVEMSSLIKLLSAGVLGIKKQRRLVPSRWSVTAVDDIVSKQGVQEILDFKLINEVLVFHDTYLGNHYEFILFPRQWSFEVIESKFVEGLEPMFASDDEDVFGRKAYADVVTGAYYANRVAVVEFLRRIKRQASAYVFL